jgi:curli biogenesis system outer membrane secretion channel CsgG
MRQSYRNAVNKALVFSVLLSAVAGVANGQGVTGYKQGQGGTQVTGAAGTNGGTGDAVQHCDKPMGALAVVEPQDYVMQSLHRYGLQSPTSLIRMMVQQSNCFIVVERGLGMQNVMQERELAKSGELRAGSNMGGGQMVSADFVLTPNVIFSENNAGGLGGAVGGVLSRKNPLLGAVAGGLKFKEAQTSMLLADSRSGVQVAAAEGSTRKADLKLGGALFGGYAGGALGGYGNTNEGKIIAAALLDNYNKVVGVVRGDPSLQRDVGTLREEAAKKTVAGAVFNEGDVVIPKIANIKMLASPSDDAKAIATLPKNEEMVVIGGEKNGYINVQGGSAAGWVKKVLLVRP